MTLEAVPHLIFFIGIFCIYAMAKMSSVHCISVKMANFAPAAVSGPVGHECSLGYAVIYLSVHFFISSLIQFAIRFPVDFSSVLMTHHKMSKEQSWAN